LEVRGVEFNEEPHGVSPILLGSLLILEFGLIFQNSSAGIFAFSTQPPADQAALVPRGFLRFVLPDVRAGSGVRASHHERKERRLMVGLTGAAR